MPDNPIKKYIETVMKHKEKPEYFSFGMLLTIFSVLYGGAVKLRETLYKTQILNSKKLPCTIISVGNITVGGTGKTPMTIYLANLIKNLGYKTVVISRGYKGGAEKTGGVVSNGKTIYMNSCTAGDEPYMMALNLKGIPVIVGQNRFDAGMLAIKAFKPDVIILDDAFQHLRLERDINLVLLDNANPFGNGYLLPRGILREPLSALLRGDAFILTRCDNANPVLKKDLSCMKIFQNKPVFKSFHVPYIYKIVSAKKNTNQMVPEQFTDQSEFLKRRGVFAFSGIAQNNEFRRVVENFQCKIKGFLEFPDHHVYSEHDMDMILRSVKAAKADAVVTTEKDYARLADKIVLPVDLAVIGIKISFGSDETVFNDFIKGVLGVKC